MNNHMNNPISETPLTQAQADALRVAFQISECQLLTTYDGSNRIEADLDYMQRSVRKAYQILKSKALNKKAQNIFCKADKVFNAEREILQAEIAELAQDTTKIIEAGQEKCEALLNRFKGHDKLLRDVYALLLKWGASYNQQMAL